MATIDSYPSFKITYVQRPLPVVAEAVRRILAPTGIEWTSHEAPAELARVYSGELPVRSQRPKDIALLLSPVALNSSTAMFNNYEDGWLTLRNCISQDLCCRTIHFSFTLDQAKYPAYRFEVLDCGNETRVVQLIRDDPKWQFLEKGIALEVEDVGRYRKRNKRDRMSRSGTLELARRMGYDLEDDRFLRSARPGTYFESKNVERPFGGTVFHRHVL